MVIDTVEDVVLGDVGDELVSTAGVAVRPFWWSNECLTALGYGGGVEPTDDAGSGAGGPDATGGGTSHTDGLIGGGSGGQTGDGSDDGPSLGVGGDEADGDEAGDALEGESVGARTTGLGGGWVAFIAVSAAVAGAALAVAAYLLLRSRRSRPSHGAGAEADAGEAPASSVMPAPMGPDVSDEDTPVFCSRCGASLDPGDKFCASCGRRL